MELSEKQAEFWNSAVCRWNIKEGATRSGKTYIDYYWIAKRIINTKNEGLIVLLGNTKGTLSRNIIEPMRSIWGEKYVGLIGSDNTIKLFGKKCHALGADNIAQVSKLQGAGIEYCYGDEITTWHKGVFDMLKSRLDKPHSVFDGTCNPEGPNHWLLQFLDSGADIFRQHYTIYDNPFLTPEFVKNLEKEYAGSVYYDRYILGRWALAEGLVYPMFSTEKNVVHLDTDPYGRYFVSIDYGTINPTSMGLWCFSGGRAVRVREFYFDSRKTARQLTDEEYYEKLETLCSGHTIENVIIDPSAASFIETVRRHGRFSVKKAKNNVLDGIRITAGFLADGRLAVSDVCQDAIREFGEYCWDESEPEDKVLKTNDHAMDDIRYFCNTVMRKIC